MKDNQEALVGAKVELPIELLTTWAVLPFAQEISMDYSGNVVSLNLSEVLPTLAPHCQIKPGDYYLFACRENSSFQTARRLH